MGQVARVARLEIDHIGQAAHGAAWLRLDGAADVALIGRVAELVREFSISYLTGPTEHYKFRRKRQGLVGMREELGGGGGEDSTTARLRPYRLRPQLEDPSFAGPQGGPPVRLNPLHAATSVSKLLAPILHDAPKGVSRHLVLAAKVNGPKAPRRSVILQLREQVLPVRHSGNTGQRES